MPGSLDSRFCVCRFENSVPPIDALERRRSFTEGVGGDSFPPVLLVVMFPLLDEDEEVEVLESCP